MKKEQQPIKWKLAGIWNSAAMKPERPLTPRSWIYASEIGQPFADRYLKMAATPYTNPANDRSRRKFLAGNVWEYITRSILVAAGIFHKEEIKIDAQPYASGLEVHGRCDFIAGGYIDKDIAMKNLTSMLLPDYLELVGVKLIEGLSGKTLEKKILELKSVSTFAMDKVERIGKALPNHTMQGFHYQRNGNLPCDVAYLCKDDLRVAQYGIDTELSEPLYENDILQMSTYYKKKKMPPVEPLAKFDKLLGKFEKNLGIEYSNYLTLLHNFKNPDDYRENVKFVMKWNRTLVRYALAELGKCTPTGKPIVITSKNKEVAAEIEKAGYKLKECIQCKIDAGAIEEEEETE